MATKKKTKKTKKNPVKSKRPVSKKASKRKTTKKKPSRKAIAKKPAPKKAIAKNKLAKKPLGRKAGGTAAKTTVREERGPDATAFLREPRRSHSGEQSGDMQGLSRRARAGSESVDELMEEGNAFEAEVVQGVEDAGDDEAREVRTHEVSEDDIPEEYLDRDKD